MNYKNIFLGLVSLLFVNELTSQFICQPAVRSKKSLTYQQVQEVKNNRSNVSNYTVNVIAYILRDDNGNFGPTAATVMAELELMQSHFEPLDICFSFLGIGEIWNSDYVENWVADHHLIATEIINNYGSTSRMDIIFVPDEVSNNPDSADFGGGSFAIPNHYFAIQEGYMGLVSTSHEMGHCLNLLHTHQHYDSYNNSDTMSICNPLLERVNGSNGQTAGDECPDTNADPTVGFDSGGDPQGCFASGPPVDCNGQAFSPPFSNIMSYARHCQFEFTQDQEDRMKAELINGSVGPLLRAPNGVVLPPSVISSGVHLISSGTFISLSPNTVYQSSGSSVVRQVASTSISLRPGFWSDPTTGIFEAYISPLCN